MRLHAAELIRALDEVARAAEASPEREACGVVLRERDGALRVLTLPNDADRWAAADPAGFPGGARRGFVLAPRALREILAAASQRGAALHAVWHSHLDAPAEPSARDLAGAFDGGAAVLPGVEWWIVPVRGGPVGPVGGRPRRFGCAAGRFEELVLAGGVDRRTD